MISHTNEPRQSCFSVSHLETRLRTNATSRPFKWSRALIPPNKGETATFSAATSNGTAIAELERVGTLHPYPARAAVFHHGDAPDSIFIVRKGKLKLSVFTRKGRCMVIRFAVVGDIMGLSAVLNQRDHEFAAQTLEPCILVNIPRKGFLQLCQSCPEVNSYATWALARDHEEMLRGIRRLAMSASVRERMAQLILDCLEFPQDNGGPMSIRINWTYSELADMVNSSRETVTRIMRQFESEQLIARRGSLVVIIDQARLKRIAC